jgi:hypothetical protein
MEDAEYSVLNKIRVRDIHTFGIIRRRHVAVRNDPPLGPHASHNELDNLLIMCQ